MIFIISGNQNNFTGHIPWIPFLCYFLVFKFNLIFMQRNGSLDEKENIIVMQNLHHTELWLISDTK